MKKRLIAILLTMVILVGLLPTAFAADTVATQGNMTMTMDGTKMKLSSTTGGAKVTIFATKDCEPDSSMLGNATIASALDDNSIMIDTNADEIPRANWTHMQATTVGEVVELDAAALGNGTWHFYGWGTVGADRINNQQFEVAGGKFVLPLTISDSSCSAHDWAVGKNITTTELGSVSGGTEAYTGVEIDGGAISAADIEGLTLSIANGVINISGTPKKTHAGGTLTVKVTDNGGDTATGTVTLPAIAKGTAVLSGKTVNGSSGTASYSDMYTIKNAADGNIASDFSGYTYAFVSSTAGASDNGSATGVTGITGNGNVIFTVTATNISGNYNDLTIVSVTAPITYASYTVNYNNNKPYVSAAAGGSATAATIGTPGATANAAVCTDTFAGYTFAGWNTAANGGGTAIPAGAVIPDSGSNAGSFADGGSITLYAQWTANELTFADGNFTETTGAQVGASKTFSAVSPASDGTGSYTYSIVPDAANIAGATIVSATGAVTVTPVNTTDKTVKIMATDANSGKTKTATYTYNGTIAKADLTITPEMAVNGTVSDSFNLADFISGVTTLYGGATKETVFNDAVSSLTAGVYGPVKGITIKFYDDDTYTTTTETAAWTALPTTAGTYYYSVAVAANAAVSDDYQTDAGFAENKTGVLTLTAPSVSSGYTVTYNAGEHGKLADGAGRSETVNRGKTPKRVPEVVANEGWKFLGWSLDGKTAVDPATVQITKRTTFTALYEELKADARHSAYVLGVGEGLFAPGRNMTRAEAVTMLSRLTDGFEEKSYTNEFPDVVSGEWYENYVGFGAGHGIVTGFPDGTFRPLDNITRGEFAAMVARFMGLEEVPGESKFTDVTADQWDAGWINALAAAGIIDGYEDGAFRSTQLIRRDEAVKIINGALDRRPDGAAVDAHSGDYANPFTDVPAGQWAYYEILEAALEHSVSDFHK